jgi:hypothetical protein
VYFDLQYCSERTLDKQHHCRDHDHNQSQSHGHHKHKTRDVPAEESVPLSDTGTPPSVQPDEQPTLYLSHRHLSVYCTLFYTPNASSTPGEVPWTNFLSAMAAVGFAPEMLYGSVWSFTPIPPTMTTPTSLDLALCIQFHEPHPSGKIPYRTSRRHGRRLNRAYGWHGMIFKLEEKVKSLSAQTNSDSMQPQ